MITLLDRRLPPELSDIIYKHYHKMIMQQICEIIKYKIAWYLYWEGSERRVGFLICERQNYYSALDW